MYYNFVISFYSVLCSFSLFFLICVFLCFILLWLNFVISCYIYTVECVFIYECGFYSFNFVKCMFDVRYILIALLFLITDLELIFVFPFLVYCGVYFYVVFVFFFILFFEDMCV